MVVHPLPYNRVSEPRVHPGEVAPGAAKPPGYYPDQDPVEDDGATTVSLKPSRKFKPKITNLLAATEWYELSMNKASSLY